MICWCTKAPCFSQTASSSACFRLACQQYQAASLGDGMLDCHADEGIVELLAQFGTVHVACTCRSSPCRPDAAGRAWRSTCAGGSFRRKRPGTADRLRTGRPSCRSSAGRHRLAFVLSPHSSRCFPISQSWPRSVPHFFCSSAALSICGSGVASLPILPSSSSSSDSVNPITSRSKPSRSSATLQRPASPHPSQRSRPACCRR